MAGAPRATVAAVCWALMAAFTATSAPVNAKSPRGVPLRLNVLLTVSPHLSETARRTLIKETERIWQRERVNLEWPAAAGGAERPAAPLRVLVIARPHVTTAESDRWPVAELVPHSNHRALAIASIDGARRVVSEASRYDILNLPVMEDYRLGLVLGRAVAHEIGHFLLATGTHAQGGLMRANVGAREFAAVGGDTFRLDDDASRWIRQHLAAGQPAVGSLRNTGFTYLP